jgi:hypothetical protein
MELVTGNNNLIMIIIPDIFIGVASTYTQPDGHQDLGQNML